jgi:NAD(P)-dependent dehydrogenase (short-subunit alcohol dehydrogenase family)
MSTPGPPYGFDLAGRRVLVTGAGQGVGRGIILGFASSGADVVVNDIDPERAEEVAEEARELGVGAEPAVFDVTELDAVHGALGSSGDVDVLVNNAGNAGVAGFVGRGEFADTGPGDWEPYLRVNLYGVMHSTHAVLPAMKANGWGRIITIVSDAGRTGDAHMAAYSAAKAGAAGFTRAVAREVARYGITANNIALGTMRTPMTEPLWADAENEQARALLRSYLVRRPGLPSDVAPLALLLASEHGSWITGQTYPLNGGFSFAL